MTQVVERLADLTGFRDRDLLDVNLAGVLQELLRPLAVSIYRCVGDPSDRRWLARARQGAGDAVALADPVWTPLESLPRLAQCPARQQALLAQDVVLQPGQPCLSVFPLFSDHQVAGVLEIETEQALSTAAIRQVGSILRVFRNFQSLLDYSERDTLTGLLNRKTFDDAFNRLALTAPAQPAAPPAGAALVVGAGQRSRHCAAQSHYIGVLDIDHFKRVNDAFGHLIGDEVLLLLSRLMRSVFRYHDRLYRFGGEEFVVLMRCRSDADAGLALHRLRTALQTFTFPQVGAITVSMGYAEVLPGDTPSLAFDRADRAVYWAKHHGRDQVCSFAALSAQGELRDDTKAGDVELF